jgi:hypothetical protein
MQWLVWLLSIVVVDAADVIRVPLIRRETPGLSLRKRGIGYSSLVDHVQPQFSVNKDMSYLGAVSVGTPPQTFLLGVLFCIVVLMQTLTLDLVLYGSLTMIAGDVMCLTHTYLILKLRVPRPQPEMISFSFTEQVCSQRFY